MRHIPYTKIQILTDVTDTSKKDTKIDRWGRYLTQGYRN